MIKSTWVVLADSEIKLIFLRIGEHLIVRSFLIWKSSEIYGLCVFVASTSFFTCLELATDTEIPPLFKLVSKIVF